MSYSPGELKDIKEFLYKTADDQLIIGHRNSEWTGLGPTVEEDIAFSSIAQDKIGQSLHIYEILHSLGEEAPDTIAFARNADRFRCCQLTEYPIGDYSFSLMRNFLFNHSEQIRFDMLSNSSMDELAMLAKKYRGEIKYHVMHSDIWIKQLGCANEESRGKMQGALNDAFNLALGIFEEGDFEDALKSTGFFEGEKALRQRWLDTVCPILEKAMLVVPPEEKWQPVYGGRKGRHTEYLQPLIDEMGAVFRLDPEAEW